MHSRVHWRSICKRVCEWSSIRQNGRVVSAFIFQCDMPSSNLRKSAYVLSLMRVHASHNTSHRRRTLFFFFVRFLACSRELRFCVHMHAMYSLWRAHMHERSRIHMQVFIENLASTCMQCTVCDACTRMFCHRNSRAHTHHFHALTRVFYTFANDWVGEQ